jgi:hypothetical protein
MIPLTHLASNRIEVRGLVPSRNDLVHEQTSFLRIPRPVRLGGASGFGGSSGLGRGRFGGLGFLGWRGDGLRRR